MKIASFIATALLATAAFANGNQTVTHNWGGALHDITLNNACVTATEVHTIQPVRNCAALTPVHTGTPGDIGSGTDWVCARWEVTHLSYPRTFTRSECTQYANHGEIGTDCVRWEEKTYFMPQTIEVQVVTSHGETDDFPGVTRHFTFPACQ